MNATQERFFINRSSDVLPEALAGLVAAHPCASWDKHGFIFHKPASPQVTVISGGGSGHEPLHAGFVGEGMLTAAVPGLLFTSPNAVQITAATEAADLGKGVVHLVKNYTGDIMNFRVAADTVDVEVETVVVADDVATDSEDGPGRRGILGTVLVEKVAGAAAARGDELSEVAGIARRFADNTRSMSAALAPGHMPHTGAQTFELPHNMMELGVGIHGERGIDRVEASAAREVVDKLLTRITQSLGEVTEVALVVGGLGSTTLLEQYVVYNDALKWLEKRGITVRRSLVGNLVTAVNMRGVSLSLSAVDAEILELIDAPTTAPAWPTAIAHEPRSAEARMAFDDAMPAQGEDNVWLSGFIEAVKNGVEGLTALDRQAGDGDFGDNMQAAFGEVETPVVGTHAEVLRVLATRLLVRAGGTSGAVFGTLFRELADAFAASQDEVEALRVGVRRALDAIGELGGAKVGDATMVDALAPAVEKLENGEYSDLNNALNAAAEAAQEGAQSTAEMTAAKGRASYVGEASRGVMDPGAIVTAWLFAGGGEL